MSCNSDRGRKFPLPPISSSSPINLRDLDQSHRTCHCETVPDLRIASPNKGSNINITSIQLYSFLTSRSPAVFRTSITPPIRDLSLQTTQPQLQSNQKLNLLLRMSTRLLISTKNSNPCHRRKDHLNTPNLTLCRNFQEWPRSPIIESRSTIVVR